ncbi:dual specificity mitogen-activated protein kinase kinase 4 isoform X6 [Vulpes vulpes]|uniref:mitogen-activated protein kinase kinase n=1 Tax=Vulpes vulpes TaxID=9627 RepID=A0ABM4Y861_VULVU
MCLYLEYMECISWGERKMKEPASVPSASAYCHVTWNTSFVSLCASGFSSVKWAQEFNCLPSSLSRTLRTDTLKSLEDKMPPCVFFDILTCLRIRSTVDEKEQKQLLMDLDVVMRSSDCPYIVQFYGALFREGDCWICMELMSTSFDKFYKYVYSVLDDVIPEEILGKITLATVKALNHLKENLKIIHRDIKPSNILLDRSGNIKLCDFGISGQLVDSIAKTRDAGCRPYMAPERIDPSASRQGYDVRSDVWSLGITLYELATGRFPYPKWNSVFDQLTQVVKGDPPQLSNSEEREFSPSFINFVNLCLTKDESKRPKYKELLKHPFILMYEERTVEVACYVCKILDQMPATPSSPMYVD